MDSRNNKILFIFIAFFISLGGFVTIANAKLVTSMANGNWNLPGTWDKRVPVTGDSVHILHDIIVGGNISTPLLYIVISGGSIDLSNNGKLSLASGSVINIESGFIIGNGNSDQLKIGGTKVYNGSDPDNPIGPASLDENTPPGGPYPDLPVGYTPLPVELLYFTAKPTQNLVNLHWSTASELNNDFFTLEKSNNGRDFVKFGEIAGNGTTNLQVDYSFTDPSPYLGLSYYRLSQTDYDGTTEVFPVVSVLFEGYKSFSVGPNPLSGTSIKLKINEMESHEPVELNIVDIQGRLVEKKQFRTDGFGNVDAEIQLKEPLQKGTYIFEIASERIREYLKVAAE